MRQPHYQPGDILPIKVKRGAVVVNEVTVRRDYGDCILAVMDLASKRAELACTLQYAEDCPDLYLWANEETLHVDAGVPRDASTVVTLADLHGWSVWASSGPHRYTLALTLVAPENKP